jgi:hypothetical protein
MNLPNELGAAGKYVDGKTTFAVTEDLVKDGDKYTSEEQRNFDSEDSQRLSIRSELVYTVGAFLREKAGNMSVWLKGSGLPVDLQMPQLTNLALTAFAQMLREKYQKALETRDFDALLADKENMPPEMLMAVAFVAKNEELHDKFWRYLLLFSDTVA